MTSITGGKNISVENVYVSTYIHIYTTQNKVCLQSNMYCVSELYVCERSANVLGCT